LHETEQRTSLGAAGPGLKVNLERSLRADARLGGHFVTGHIDGTGAIRRWEQVGKDYLLEVEIPKGYAPYVVPKGCIAIDGMSLTVVDVTSETFTVWIIPHTREVTNLSERKAGDLVNLEFDLLAKYTEKILQSGRVSS
jgi:riboflavin synthase